MYHRTQKGFSLVEVMILFVALAVTMAASIPLISKKSHPVPKRIPHGVYRCYISQDGKITQETYSSFRRLSSGFVKDGERCTFYVPKANYYKIDLYSAGAGGTKYAAYMAQQGPSKNTTVTMAKAESYAKDNSHDINNLFADDALAPTDEELYDEFKKYSIVRYNSTGNAGAGGLARMKYERPRGYQCAAVRSGLEPQKIKRDKSKATYEQKTADREKAKKELDSLKEKKEDEKTAARAVWSKWNTYYSDVSSAWSTASANAGYANSAKDYLGKLASCLDNNSLTNLSRYNTYASNNGNRISSNAVTNPTKPDNCFYGCSDLADNISSLNTLANDVSSAATTVKDMISSVTSSVSSNYSKWKEEAASGSGFSNKPSIDTSSIDSLNGYLSQANKVYDSMSSTISENVTRAKNAIDSAGEDLNDEIESAEKKLSSSQEAESSAKELYEAASASYNAAYYENLYAANAKGLSRPQVYQNDDGSHYWFYDYTPNESRMPNVSQQFEEYCSNAYKQFHTDNPGFPKYEAINSWTEASEYGGYGGRGAILKLVYKLSGNGSKNDPAAQAIANRYNHLDQHYPRLTYIGDLYGNVNRDPSSGQAIPSSGVSGQGFIFIECEKKADGSMNDAKCIPAGTYLNASSGSGATGTVNESETLSGANVIKTGSKILLKAEKGKEVDKYLAVHVPYQNVYGDMPLVFSQGIIIAPIEKLPTPGEGGTVGFEKNNQVYNKGEYEIDYTWKAVVKDGGSKTIKTSDEGRASYRATDGKDVVLRANQFAGLNYTLEKFADTTTDAAGTKPTIVDKDQEPEVKISSTLWQKKYKVGLSGLPGNKEQYQSRNLGKVCKITLGKPGEIFDYMAIRQQAISSNVPRDTYINKQKELLEKTLETSIICVDSMDYIDNPEEAPQENIMFKKSLEGGKYRLISSDWNWPFNWKRNATKHVVPTSLDLPNQPDFTGITSKWAKILKMMDPLTTYKIGYYGLGTTLTDKCVVPKGKYSIYSRIVQWQYTTPSLKDYGTYSNGKQNVADNPEYTGYTKDGVNCYVNTGRELGNNDMNATEKSMYEYENTPTKGGGGAVVITW